MPAADDFYANNNAEPPFWARSHADGGTAVIAGDFYTGDLYPSVLDGALFLSDFGDRIIRALVLNADGSFNRQVVLADPVGAVVEMTMGPDEHMYYVDLAGGNVGRFVFSANATASNPNGGSGDGGSGGGGSGGGSGAAAKGDFDSDGDTDGADFLAWQRGYGSTSAAITAGDADGNGSVDGEDLAAWSANFGTPETAPLADLAAAYSMNISQANAASDDAPFDDAHLGESRLGGGKSGISQLSASESSEGLPASVGPLTAGLTPRDWALAEFAAEATDEAIARLATAAAEIEDSLVGLLADEADFWGL